MGSLAVLSMADHAGLSAPGGMRPVHPFFTGKRNAASDAPQETSKSNNALEPEKSPICSLDAANGDNSQDDGKPKNEVKRRKKRAKAEIDTPVAGEKPRAKKRTKPAQGGNIANHFGRPDGGQKPEAEVDTKSTEAIIAAPDKQGETSAPPQPLSHTPPSVLNTDNASRPKKMLKLNPKTGTIGSPPKPQAPKVSPDLEASEQTLPTDSGIQTSSNLVRVQYGSDNVARLRIGEKVDAILRTPPKTKSPRTPRKKAVQRPDPSPRIKKSPTKITHPFFAGKGKGRRPSIASAEKPPTVPQIAQPKRNTIQSSTPCSPKKNRVAPSNMANPMPQFSVKSMGLKFPGSKPPAWPYKDMVHIRGDSLDLSRENFSPPHSIPFRKSKGRAVRLRANESLIDMITQRMNVPAHAEAVRNANSDDFLPPPAELRLPAKHFESGSKLQRRILPELKCSSRLMVNSNAKRSKKGKDTVADNDGVATHPRQLVRLFNQLRTSLSAFDRADCDNICWTQKYAPISAAEVIQPGQEAFLLKEWLQALVVQSVDTGSGPGGDDKAKKNKDAKTSSPKKRGRKRKQLDDFIVSSDEEADQMAEISDTELDWAPSGKFGILKKTVIRTADRNAKRLGDPARLTNAIVISGPHGCGKTAAVYAVAKELDFEVFEINSSSRRSGKDVDDKIGDMLKHHHVSHQNDSREKPAQKEGDAEAQKAADELAQEIASGKQKTMASFFAKKTAPAKKAVQAPPAVEAPNAVPKPAALKRVNKDPPKGQKQSLILLDEADILYDEDKQFWTRVVELIVKSKRPFIITCNDETLLPLRTLNLHGIFRLNPPPTDLAVDRLLLVAANEGHALQREPVEALYVARNHDLRAATMELNYWCQIGVGDRRGGFDWFYPRWPKGVDLDENREIVRVVSEGTYQLGMGWLGRDMVVDKETPIEEEILQQAWDLWNLDAGHWQDSAELSAWASDLKELTTDPAARLAALAMYDTFTDAMSAADLCSSKSFAQFKEVCHPPSRTRTLC